MIVEIVMSRFEHAATFLDTISDVSEVSEDGYRVVSSPSPEIF